MPTAAIGGFGTQVQIGNGGGTEVFTTIAELRDITGPGFSLDTFDVSNQSSPGAWKEFLPGLLDGGDITFDISFVPTNATHNYSAGLLKDMTNRTRRNFKIVFPNAGATTWTIPAYVTGFETGAPVNDALTASVTLRVAGQPTLA